MANIGAIPAPPPKWIEEVFFCEQIIGSIVELQRKPSEHSQFVFVNGLLMTNGSDLDYTITEAIITFNGGVLTETGNVTIKYSYS